MAIALRSPKLAVDVAASGLIAITDVAVGGRWGGGVPGWVTLSDGTGSFILPLSAHSVEATGDSIRLTFGRLSSRELGTIQFRMDVALRLDNDGLELKILELGCPLQLISVEYPAHLHTTVSGAGSAYVAVPFNRACAGSPGAG